MKQHQLVAPLVAIALSTLAAGCAESTPPAASAPIEIGRAAAVDTARADAAGRFRLGALSTVNVSRSGRYWLVDLRSRDGEGLHYAIATDGSIRERRVVQ